MRIFSLLGKKLKDLVFRKHPDTSSRVHWLIEPLILLVLALIAYGLFATQLGYYWDNWGFSWMRHFRDSGYLIDSFAALRPMQGYFEAVLTPLFGINSTAWQFFSILTRWLSAVTFWWVLRTYWPANRQMNFAAALFFLVYPGYIQQPVAQGYPYVWVFMSLYFVSLVLLVRLVRGAKRPIFLWIVTLLLSLLTLFSIEYLFGLELIRLVFVWLAVGKQDLGIKNRLVRTLKYYWPFVLPLGTFIFWRLTVFTQSVYQPVFLDKLRQSPLRSLTTLGQTALQTLSTVSVGAWSKVFQVPPAEAFSTKLWVIYIIAVLGSFLAIFFILPRLVRADELNEKSQPWQWIIIGLLACILVGIPYFVAGLRITLAFPDDHYTMPFIFGVSLFLAGILGLLAERIPVAGLIGLLVALGVGYQIHTCALYRADTRLLQNFIWELSWRAPGLEPGTIFVTEDLDVFSFDDDEAVGYAINWAYRPENQDGALEYVYLFASARLGNAIPSFTAGQPVHAVFQTDTFESTTDHLVVMEYSPPSCLHILSPVDGDRINLMLDPSAAWRREKTEVRLLPELLLKALPLSNLNQVIVDSSTSPQPPAFLFGAEPAHRWCFYYEKADLARQAGDWKQVTRLADEAFAAPYYPDNYYEYLLFIEGYLKAGRVEDARIYTKKVAETGPVLLPSLCLIWQNAQQSAQAAGQDSGAIQKSIKDLGLCPVP